MTPVHAEELTYIDPAAGSDKFYRVFSFGAELVVQYGRNGTYGTFKRSHFSTASEASTAATKQAAAKFKKGYERTKSVELSFPAPPSDSELDQALNSIAAGHLGGRDESQAAVRAAARDNLAYSSVEVDSEVLGRVLGELSARVPTGVVPDDTVIRPMLAETVAAERIEAVLADDRWCAQPKLDGERFVIEVLDGAVAVYNRQGQPKTANVAEAVIAPFRSLTEGRWVFDGEVVGRSLHLFDLVAAPGFVSTSTPFSVRYQALRAVFDAVGIGDAPVALVGCAWSSEDKTALLDQMMTEDREGVIFRDCEAGYQPGKRSAVLLKHKFLKTADCVVVATNVSGKANAQVAVYAGTGELQVVGSVSTIGKGEVRVGDVVEIQFLYVTDPAHPRMYQPRILRTRDDKSALECSTDQFANAGTNKVI
jgi:predicted DNA-binding WGR domain protein